jgi:putative transcriptional regulator
MASFKSNDNYLAGKLLLAMPNMGDQRFNRAVIFVCAHDENGAMGIVINNEMPEMEFTDLIPQLKIESDIKVDLDKVSLPVMCGGPVETGRGFLLHSADFSRVDTMRVDQTYGVTGTVDALKELAIGKGPDDVLFALGYAGWDAGQLEAELQDNAWLVVDPDHDLVFGDDPEEKWNIAVSKLGVDPTLLSGAAGRA